MSFQQNIQQWVHIDNQIKNITETLKELREQKNSITNKINEHIETNQLSNVSVKFGMDNLDLLRLKKHNN